MKKNRLKREYFNPLNHVDHGHSMAVIIPYIQNQWVFGKIEFPIGYAYTKSKFHIVKEMAMENEKCCSGMCCALTFLAGAVVGGGIALLLAPQSGERTRRQLKRMAEDAEEKIEDCYDEIKERAAEMVEKV